MSVRLVVGSTALQAYLELPRPPRDLDLFSTEPEQGAETCWHPLLTEWLPEGTNRVATLDELYTIKVSHAYWVLKNGSWTKHMNDVVRMKRAGAQLIPWLHDLLYKVCEDLHGKKKVDLNADAAEFFSDTVKRVYDHDSIHASIAYGERPMYLATLKEGSTVDVDLTKLWALSWPDLIKYFREETYVIALERFLIPRVTTSPVGAYKKALCKMITSLTKGRSALFIVENYDVFRRPDIDYVDRHRANAHKLIRLEG
jgi:hypothetical protein